MSGYPPYIGIPTSWGTSATVWVIFMLRTLSDGKLHVLPIVMVEVDQPFIVFSEALNLLRSWLYSPPQNPIFSEPKAKTDEQKPWPTTVGIPTDNLRKTKPNLPTVLGQRRYDWKPFWGAKHHTCYIHSTVVPGIHKHTTPHTINTNPPYIYCELTAERA